MMANANGRDPEAWHGFVVTQRRLQVIDIAAWKTEVFTVSAIPTGWAIDLSGHAEQDWDGLARALIGGSAASLPHIMSHGDPIAGEHVVAAFAGDRLTGALLVRRVAPITGREWLAARLGTPLDPAERFRLLAGRPGGAMRPRGPTVCFCCDVGHNEITDAIAAGGVTVEAIGAATRAGTNCGCCRPELARLIDDAHTRGAPL